MESIQTTYPTDRKPFFRLNNREVIMFESVEEKKGGTPWGVIAGLVAFAGLLAAGYFVIT